MDVTRKEYRHRLFHGISVENSAIKGAHELGVINQREKERLLNRHMLRKKFG
jgi:hypothetical protein